MVTTLKEAKCFEINLILLSFAEQSHPIRGKLLERHETIIRLQFKYLTDENDAKYLIGFFNF